MARRVRNAATRSPSAAPTYKAVMLGSWLFADPMKEYALAVIEFVRANQMWWFLRKEY